MTSSPCSDWTSDAHPSVPKAVVLLLPNTTRQLSANETQCVQLSTSTCINKTTLRLETRNCTGRNEPAAAPLLQQTSKLQIWREAGWNKYEKCFEVTSEDSSSHHLSGSSHAPSAPVKTPRNHWGQHWAACLTGGVTTQREEESD